MRFTATQRIVGAITALTSTVMIPPFLLSLFIGDGEADAFFESFALSFVAGLVLWIPARRARDELRLRDGFLVTSISWVIVSAIGALPFILGASQLSLTDAVFESVSGLTTTGATVISRLDALPESLLFYRQSLCFVGGMGIIILAVAILPMLRVGGSQLFRAETSGPVKDNKLTPRVAETARALWFVYLGLNAVCALAFWVAGMGALDAVGHAFSTVATAGFSTHDASIGHYDSELIETVAMIFMFVGGINFSLHFVAWKRASGSAYFADPELRAYFAITMVVAVLVSFSAFAAGAFDGIGAAFRHGIFQTVSNITTTGYITTGFAHWGGLAPMLLILVGFVGACSGSTTGGMKVVRVVVLFRQGAREVLQLVHPRARFVVKLGGVSVPGAVLAAISGFCTLYVLSFIVMALLLSATGVEPITAWSAVAACLNNMGPGLGEVAVHFEAMNDAAVWVCSFAMVLGRLEVFTLLVLFTPGFWRS